MAAKLGSGARFRALSARLAARGAHNPDALAAYIGRRKFGASKFAKLGAKARKGGRSHSHANEQIRWGHEYITSAYGDLELAAAMPVTGAPASPAASASDGPRVTGLGPVGQMVYGKLRKKGMDAKACLAMARRAEAMHAKAAS